MNSSVLGWLRNWVPILCAGLLAGCASAPVSVNEAAEWGADSSAAIDVYDKAIDMLAQGRQAEAEAFLATACREHVDSQRILFLNGTLLRSRFDQDSTVQFFAMAYRLDSHSLLGEAANIVVSMDAGIGIDIGFERLESMIAAHPDEILLRWLYAMETVGRESHVPEGLRQCEAMLEQWEVGPVTLHKAYSNFLTVGGIDPDKALEHRYIAAELEPSAQNYEGLARTLEIYKRYAEAEPVYAKMAEMDANRALRWFQWGNCLAYLNDFEAATEKFEKAYELERSEVVSLVCWGRCLERLGQPEEGYKKYALARKTNPQDQQAAAYVAHSKLYGYGTSCDFEVALELSSYQGKPAIDTLSERIAQSDASDNPLAPERSDILMAHLTGLAEDGDAEAAYSLAMILHYGIGVGKDSATAESWVRRAAERGHVIAGRMINPPFESWNRTGEKP